MNTKEKTDNELIAEFMGLIPERWRLTRFHKFKIYWCHEPNGYGVTEEMLGYDSKIEFLLPVARKIIDIPLNELVNANQAMAQSRVASFNLRTKYSDLYKAVVEFIKWYRSQPEGNTVNMKQ